MQSIPDGSLPNPGQGIPQSSISDLAPEPNNKKLIVTFASIAAVLVTILAILLAMLSRKISEPPASQIPDEANNLAVTITFAQSGEGSGFIQIENIERTDQSPNIDRFTLTVPRPVDFPYSTLILYDGQGSTMATHDLKLSVSNRDTLTLIVPTDGKQIVDRISIAQSDNGPKDEESFDFESLSEVRVLVSENPPSEFQTESGVLGYLGYENDHDIIRSSFYEPAGDFINEYAIAYSLISGNGRNYGIAVTVETGGYSYTVGEEPPEFAIVNGRIAKLYDNLSEPIFASKPRDPVVAYIATNDKETGLSNREDYLVVNNQEYGPYDRVRKIAISPDGTRFAYVATSVEKITRDNFKELDYSDLMDLYGYNLDIDLSCLKNPACVGAEMELTLNESEEWDKLERDLINEFSQEDIQVKPSLMPGDEGHEPVQEEFWSPYFGGRHKLIVSAQEEYPYYRISQPVFSPDGKHIAYAAVQDFQWHLFVDHKKMQALPFGVETSSPFLYNFSSNSYAYVTRDRSIIGQQVVFNGDIGEPRLKIDHKSLLMSDDGKTLAYVAKDLVDLQRYYSEPNDDAAIPFYVFVNGKRVWNSRDMEYEPGSFVLSPDGQHWALRERVGRDYQQNASTPSRIVSDGKEIAAPQLVSKPYLRPGTNTLVYYSYAFNEERPLGGFTPYAVDTKVHLGDKSISVDHEIVSDLYFSPDGTYVGYGALKENKLLWITHQL